MIKQRLSLEICKNENLFQMMLPPEATLGECFDVVSQFRQYIIDRIQAENEKQPEAPKED